MHGLCVHSTESLLVPQGIRSSIACSGNEPFYWSTRLAQPLAAPEAAYCNGRAV
jgi:hypothetical protein